MIFFDHIAISAETLAEAQSHVEQALGVSMQTGGEHDVFSTHNALLGLENGLYLEAIAINPAAPTPARPRWFDLDRFHGSPRLTNWICRTEDLEAALQSMPAGMGVPVDLKRGDLRWRMAVPQSGVLAYDNVAPALIQWQTKAHPAHDLAPSGVCLTRLILRHPDADAMRAIFAPQLNDSRVIFETGTPGMEATFETPHGPRVLGG